MAGREDNRKTRGKVQSSATYRGDGSIWKREKMIYKKSEKLDKRGEENEYKNPAWDETCQKDVSAKLNALSMVKVGTI